MVGIAKICLLVLVASTATGQKSSGIRSGKSLVNTFPFNARGNGAARAHHHDHHDDHHAHHAEPVDFDARASRQGQGDDIDLNIGAIAAAGDRCIDKVVMVEETEYDDHIECKHSYSEKCHTTYTTDFEPQQEEECSENFKKSCFIEYKKVAVQETAKKCTLETEIIPGNPECKKVSQSVCITSQHEHEVEDDIVECKDVYDEKCEPKTQGYTTTEECTKWPRRECTKTTDRVKKYTPHTECKPNVIELCGDGITTRQVPGSCYDEPVTVVQEVPEETCNLEPQRECKHVTKLVPFLKPTEECVDIPKEVCSRSRKNPRKVQKPVVKKWCYTPTAESGLA